MALSNYPQRIPSFPTHKNLVEDVDASHINNIQTELVGIAKTLGTLPQVYNSVQLTGGDSSADTVGFTGALVDDTDPLFSAMYGTAAAKTLQFDHGSVKARLDNIERGRQFHCFQLRAGNLPVPAATQPVDLAHRPKAVKFPKPDVIRDPYAMHNGVGVTLRKAGFWMFSANVVFTLLGSPTSKNQGVFQATIDFDGNYVDAMTRERVGVNNDHPVLTPVLMGFFSKGDIITLRVAHDSQVAQRIRTTRLSGFLLRENVT